jgi:hypothetical protein
MKLSTFMLPLFFVLSLYPLMGYSGICGSTLIKKPSLITLPNPPSFFEKEETKNQEEDDSKEEDHINQVANTNSFFAKKGIPQVVEYIIYDFLKENTLKSNDLENLGKTAKVNRIPKEYFYIKKHIVLKTKMLARIYTEEEIINYLKLHLQPSEMTNSHIERIELDGYPCTHAVLNFIATTFPKLKVINLKYTASLGAFTDEHLKAIASLPQLTHFVVEGECHQFTDKGLISLSTLKKLTYLTLTGINNKFTDRGLQALYSLKNLTFLLLQGNHNKFTDKGLISLSLGALENLKLLVLDGFSNEFTDKGLISLIVLENLKLLVLIGFYNEFTDEGLISLSTLKNLDFLSLEGNQNQFTDKGLISLGALANLTHLRLKGDNNRFTDIGLQVILSLKKLKKRMVQGIDRPYTY